MKLSGDNDHTFDAAEGRDLILYNFMHEVRHAYQGDIEKQEIKIEGGEIEECFGFKYSWVDLILVISTSRYCASFATLEEYDQENLAMLESLTKEALTNYDAKTAIALIHFVGINGVDVSDDLVCQKNQQLTLDFFESKPIKARFKKLPNLLKQSWKHDPNHSRLLDKIYMLAAKINIPPNEMDYVKSFYMDMESIKW